MIKGNKGEWSELYVLLRLLADGRLYAADAELKRLEEAYSVILSIFRNETSTVRLEYRPNETEKEVALYWNGSKIKSIQSDILARYAGTIFAGMEAGGDGDSSFGIDGAQDIMDDLKTEKLKAPSSDKTDIQMRIHDNMTGYNAVVGYSIKSKMGSPSSLFNASGATNFQYEVTGITDEDAQKINDISTRTKIIDRIHEIEKRGGAMTFTKVINDTFAGNLMMIDSMMEDIISHMLVQYYKNGKNRCAEIARILEQEDPLGYHRDGIYTYKIKKFLCAVALGLKPSKKWDGLDEANGGYIVVKKDGDVVAYHLYNRNMFETYLLNSTRMEKGKTHRHNFASIYEEDGKKYINLNLQIRFI